MIPKVNVINAWKYSISGDGLRHWWYDVADTRLELELEPEALKTCNRSPTRDKSPLPVCLKVVPANQNVRILTFPHRPHLWTNTTRSLLYRIHKSHPSDFGSARMPGHFLLMSMCHASWPSYNSCSGGPITSN